MLTKKRKEIVEIVGLVTIVASLLFLAIEVRQSNRIAIASTEIGIRTLYAEQNRNISSNIDVARLLSKAKNPDSDMSEVERLQLLTIAMDGLNVWLSIETACDNEMVQAATCAELVDDIRTNVSSFPGMQPVWRSLLEDYPSLGSTVVYATIGRALENQDKN